MNLKYFIYVLTFLSFASCNDEIFIKETFFDEKMFKIEGDGGICHIKHRPKNLTAIDIDVNNLLTTIDTDQNDLDSYSVVTYDKNGNKIDNGSPLSMVSHIVYSSSDIMFTLSLEKNYVTFSSIENTSMKYVTIPVVFHYGDNVKEYVYVTVTNGRLKEFVTSDFNLEDTVIKDDGTYNDYVTLQNNGNSPAIFNIRPYKNTFGILFFDTVDSWATNLDYHGRVPYVVDNSVVLMDMPVDYYAILGKECGYPIESVYKDISVDVTIPANSSANVIVRYISASVPFTATYRNPISQRMLTTSGKCKIMIPFTHEVKFEK